MDKLEEFKNDLIALFKKHDMLVLKDSVSISFSPLYVHIENNIKKRDITFKFSQLLTDKQELKEHADKYGCIVDSYPFKKIYSYDKD